MPSAAPPALDFAGNPDAVSAVAEAHRLAFGHQFNPTFASEISRIDPLPQPWPAAPRPQATTPVGDSYWLYVVFDCATPSPHLVRVRNPFRRLLANSRETEAYSIPAKLLTEAAE